MCMCMIKRLGYGVYRLMVYALVKNRHGLKFKEYYIQKTLQIHIPYAHNQPIKFQPLTIIQRKRKEKENKTANMVLTKHKINM